MSFFACWSAAVADFSPAHEPLTLPTVQQVRESGGTPVKSEAARLFADLRACAKNIGLDNPARWGLLPRDAGVTLFAILPEELHTPSAWKWIDGEGLGADFALPPPIGAALLRANDALLLQAEQGIRQFARVPPHVAIGMHGTEQVRLLIPVRALFPYGRAAARAQMNRFERHARVHLRKTACSIAS